MFGSIFNIAPVLYPFLILGVLIGLGVFCFSFTSNRVIEASLGLAPPFTRRLISTIAFAILLVAGVLGWFWLTSLTNEQIAQAAIQDVPAVGGTTDLRSVALDPSIIGGLIDRHEVDVKQGTTSKPAIVTYRWTAPPIINNPLPMAAAYLTSFNGKNIEISPGMPCTAPKKDGAVATCTHPQPGTHTYVFEWFLNATTTVEIALDISLGAVAIDGEFVAQICAKKGADLVCDDYGTSADYLLEPGADGLNIQYQLAGKAENLSTSSGEKTTSADGRVTVDAANARIRLTFPITYPSGLSESQWNMLTLGGTAFSALFGSGVFFAFRTMWDKSRADNDDTKPKSGQNRPKYSAGRKIF